MCDMETNEQKQIRPGLKRKSLAFGILVLTLGLFWLAYNFGMISDRVWDHIISWPMLLIAIGLVLLLGSKHIFRKGGCLTIRGSVL